MAESSETNGSKTRLLKAEGALADLELKEEMIALIQAAKDETLQEIKASEERIRSLAWKVVTIITAATGSGVGAVQFLK